MSDKFSLMSEYTTQGKETKKVSESADTHEHKVKYQEYILEVDSKERSVYIPIRECENFEIVLENTTNISSGQLKQLLRDFRGIRNIG